jgi:hypothetical protein
MSEAKQRARRHRGGRRSLGAMVLLLGMGTWLLTTSSPWSAAQAINTETTATTLSASPSSVVASSNDPDFVAESTTLSAVVSFPQKGATSFLPGGTVTFSATDPHGDTLSLGSSPLSACPEANEYCASLTSNLFFVSPDDTAAGVTVWTVMAAYSGGSGPKYSAGEFGAAPSSGTTTVDATTGQFVQCESEEGCNDFAYNADETAEVTLSLPCQVDCYYSGPRQSAAAEIVALRENNPEEPSGFDEYVGFGAADMADCQLPGADIDEGGISQNALAEFPDNEVSQSEPATIIYTLFDQYALDQGESANPDLICYSQSVQFTTASGTKALFDAPLDQYEGDPPLCNTKDTNLPCISQTVFNSEVPYWSVWILSDVDPGAGKH